MSGIAGTVFRDANVNGVRDAGEASVGGRAVYLDYDRDHFPDNGEPFVVSAADGSYAFSNVAAGTYGLWENVPTDWNATTPRLLTVTVDGVRSSAGNDFGSVPRSAVGGIFGFVFSDVNASGTPDTGERNGVPGAVVFLDADDDGVLDAGERQSSASSSDGYGFSNLLPGRYVVRLVPPAGMRQTTPAAAAPYVIDLKAGDSGGILSFGVAPLPNPATLSLVADATVKDRASAAVNFGEDPGLAAGIPTQAGASDSETYLKFDLSSVGAFTTAKLRLFGGLSSDGAAVPVSVRAVSDTTWSESLITWNNKPTVGDVAAGGSTSVAGTERRWYEWSVGDYLRQRKAANANSVTLVLRGTLARASAAVFNSDESPDPALRPRIDFDAGPSIADVLVSGSRWSSGFLGHLSQKGYSRSSSYIGFALPPATSPPAPPLPWTNLDRITVRFNEPALVRQGDLHVRGVSGAEYPVTGFTYNSFDKVATWTLARPIGADRVTVELSPAVSTAGGNPIGGEGFRYRFDVLPGDASRDGHVSALDLWQVRSRLFRMIGRPGSGPLAYSIFHDLDGDTRITALDLAAARALAVSASVLPQ